MRCRAVHDCLGRRGWTLLEMLMLIWVASISLVVGVAIVLGAFQVEKRSAEQFRRHTLRASLTDQFRHDVAHASASLKPPAELAASPMCLLLKLADGRTVAYTWDEEHLERSEVTGSSEKVQRIVLEPGCRAVEFAQGGPRDEVLTLRLLGEARASAPVVLLEAVAALGGDVR